MLTICYYSLRIIVGRFNLQSNAVPLKIIDQHLFYDYFIMVMINIIITFGYTKSMRFVVSPFDLHKICFSLFITIITIIIRFDSTSFRAIRMN